MNHDDSASKRLRFRRKREGPITADALMARLEADPEWVAKRDERHRQWRAGVEENFRAAAPVEADLRRAGVQISSVNDLIYYRLKDVPAAIPVLLRWLPRVENIAVKECIVRALTDKAAKPLAAPALIEEFRNAAITDDPRILNLKSAIANALSVVADDLVYDKIVGLIRDRRHGWSRAELAIALQRMKNPAATEVLIEILDEDPDLNEPAPALIVTTLQALGNRKALKARKKIERFLNHTSPIVRKEAQKSLDKIDRAERKA